jgi:hypothetical protein
MSLSNQNQQSVQSRDYRPLIWRGVCILVAVYCAALAMETALRISFPWDMYFWPESPFLTSMIKLDHHLPIYTSPADGNSFVYSPGLEYLCYAFLKPFHLELDIRFCRVVVVLLGLLGSGFGAAAIVRLLRGQVTRGRFWWVSLGCLWLVLSKNFLAEFTHPDNLHTCHALALFFLTLVTVETKSFRLALLTAFIGGLGVLTKQTNFLAWCGPLAAFTLFTGWERKRLFAITAMGGLTFLSALYLLWQPRYGRFFTFEVVSHQGASVGKIYHLIIELLYMDRGLLLMLGLFAAFYLVNASDEARRYFLIWCCVGFFSVLPNLTAFLKVMGMWNNLIIFQVWLVLIVWPAFILQLNKTANATAADNPPAAWPASVTAPLLLIVVVFLVLLLPIKQPPKAGHYAFCQAIESAVTRDVAAGKKVLVSHGAEFLIKAGDTSVPLDQANTLLELGKATRDNLSDFPSRLAAHHYDRIYLIQSSWYGSNIVAEIEKDYVDEPSIKNPGYSPKLELGYSELMMDDCRVMVPRR